MNDTDIKALVERLRSNWRYTDPLCGDAADALEALQAEYDKERQIAEAQAITMRGLYQDIESLRETKDTFFRNAEAWEARAEKAELERDAALFDKAIAGGKVRVARNAALEEAAQVADKHWNGKNAIGEAIRALMG